MKITHVSLVNRTSTKDARLALRFSVDCRGVVALTGIASLTGVGVVVPRSEGLLDPINERRELQKTNKIRHF